jgi:hypothetical protein
MQLKSLIKLIIGAAILVAGVQFSLAYVNFLQLKSIMESEALDARRSGGNATEKNLIRSIRKRAEVSSVDVPDVDAISFDVTGLNDKKEDLVITAEYDEEVNLFVHKVRWPRVIEARADAPN